MRYLEQRRELPVKFATFVGRDNRPVYVNPERVTLVKDTDARTSLIYFDNDQWVEVMMQSNSVVEFLSKARET